MDKYDQEQTDKEHSRPEPPMSGVDVDPGYEAAQAAAADEAAARDLTDEEDAGGYRPHESLGAAVMQQFGIDPDNVFECTITIETLRHQETVSVKLKVKPPKGSHNALLQRMKYYNLVEKAIKLDGVPEG